MELVRGGFGCLLMAVLGGGGGGRGRRGEHNENDHKNKAGNVVRMIYNGRCCLLVTGQTAALMSILLGFGN